MNQSKPNPAPNQENKPKSDADGSSLSFLDGIRGYNKYPKIFRTELSKYIPMTKPTRIEVLEVIKNQYKCSSSCPYTEICPRMLDSLMSRDCLCYIRANYQDEFDRFYNLYFGDSEGIKNEMRSSAYRLAAGADSDDKLLAYFNSLTKMVSTFYAPEKTGKDSTISEINIFFDELKSEVKQRGKKK